MNCLWYVAAFCIQTILAVDGNEDPCGALLRKELGENATKTHEIMKTFSSLYGGDGPDACSTTQLFSALAIAREFPSIDGIGERVSKDVELQYTTMGPYIQPNSFQTKEQHDNVFSTLKSNMFQMPWVPVVAQCYWINFDLGIAHTFSIQREASLKFSIWQSFVSQYDIYDWINETTNEYVGVLPKEKVEEFIEKLDSVSNGSLPWDQVEELQQQLFRASSGIQRTNPAILNIGCNYYTNYDISIESCEKTIQNLLF